MEARLRGWNANALQMLPTTGSNGSYVQQQQSNPGCALCRDLLYYLLSMFPDRLHDNERPCSRRQLPTWGFLGSGAYRKRRQGGRSWWALAIRAARR